MPLPILFRRHVPPPGPSAKIVAITAADSNLTTPVRGLFVGTGGNVKITDTEGNAATFNNVMSGSILPVACARVWATGTTASGFVGLY